MTKTSFAPPLLVVPKHEEARAAQAMYNDPDSIPKKRPELAATLRSHYLSLGKADKIAATAAADTIRQFADRHVRHGVWRASLAPILHGIELEYDRIITERRQMGLPLTPPTNASVSHIDRVSECYGKYTGKNLRFLQAAGWWAQKATTAFLSRAHNQEPAYWQPLLSGSAYMHSAYILCDAGPTRGFFVRRPPISYIRDIGCAANVTTLNLLARAHHHTALWADSQKDQDKTEIMIGKVEKLGWTQFVNASFFDKTFGDQAEGGLETKCPFAHAEATIAAGGIWAVRSLANGPWRVDQNCPANIELSSPRDDRCRTISAATLRLTNAMYIAAETLWAP
jgi:hypothetical protein